MEENSTQWRDQVDAWNKAYKRKKKIIILSVLGAILVAALAVVSYFFIVPAIGSRVVAHQAKVVAYNQGLQLQEEGKLDEAAEAFWKAGDYKDAKDYSGRLNYDRAEKLLAEGKVTYAALAFGKAGDYKDAHDRSFELWDRFADRMTSQNNDYGTCIAWINDDGTPGIKYDDHYQIVDRYGQWRDLVDIHVESGVIGTRRDGKVVCAGTEQDIELDWHDMIAARWCFYHIVGLQSDGTVKIYCGYVRNQENCTMHAAVKGWTDVISVCQCNEVLIGLKADGTLLTATCALYAEDTIGRKRMQDDLALLENAVAVRSQYSGNQAAVLQADGTIRCIGDDKAEAFGDFDPQKGVLIAASFPDRSQQHYDQALAYLAQGQTAQAAMAFGRAGAYKDAHQRSMELWNQIVRRGTIATNGKVIAALRPDGTVAVVDPGKTMGKKPLNSDKQYVALASANGRIWGITLEGTAFPIGVEKNPLSEYHDIVMITKSSAANRYPAYLLRSDGTVTGEKTNSLAWANVTNMFLGGGNYTAAFADGTARYGYMNRAYSLSVDFTISW